MSAVSRWCLLLGAMVGVAIGVVAVACQAAGAGESDGPPVGRPGLIVGVVANALDDDMPAMTRSARAVGVGWMREELRWYELEPRQGRWSYARFDRLMATTASQGVRVLPLLYGSPRWTGARSPNRLPRRLSQWSAFVRAAVARYGPGGAFWRAHPHLDPALAPRVWEVWNEAYLPQFSLPRPDPARYAAVLRAAVTAGRAASGDVQFLASAETTYRAADGTDRSWLGDMAAADPAIGQVIDGLAVHPYALASPLRTTGPFRFSRLGSFEETLSALGVGPRPLWITEMGWSTCTRRPLCQTQAQQAGYLRSALELVAGRYQQQVAAFFAYRLDDLRGPASDQQARFGLVQLDGRRKPAWSVLREAARQSARIPTP